MRIPVVILALGGFLMLGRNSFNRGEAPAPPTRQQAQLEFKNGNFKAAIEGFRKLALNPQTPAAEVAEDLPSAINSLMRLDRIEDVDDYLEQLAKVQGRPHNWIVLQALAQNYDTVNHWGMIVAGKFYRGYRHQGGQQANAVDRDHVRALQLFEQARKELANDADHPRVAEFYRDYALALSGTHQGRQSWQLQILTDINQLPDVEPGHNFNHQAQSAPVDEQGNPILYTTPKSFDASRSDGERWRYCLAQAAELDPANAWQLRLQWADFLNQQFGPQTLQEYRWYFQRSEEDGKSTEDKNAAIFQLHTLTDEETIARLATGIKRFKLADEYNPIKIYQTLVTGENHSAREQSLERLANLMTERRQYTRAAEYWKQLITAFGPGGNDYRKKNLDQILRNWAEFESEPTQPAGRGATVNLVFRNGTHVDFQSFPIKVDQLLKETQQYLKSDFDQRNWQRTQIESIGHRLLEKDGKKYLGEANASWSLDLEPLPDHFDKRVTVTTPLQQPGAYLLVGNMQNGNTTRIIVWIADMVIAEKQLDGKRWYFVADAVNGSPIPEAQVEFFGWKQEQIGRTNKFRTLTSQFADKSDANGQIFATPTDLKQDYQWMTTARRKDGSGLAYLGFEGVWYSRVYDQQYNAIKALIITDRPVYRPNQKVQYKAWIRHAKYDQATTSDFAHQPIAYRILNPKGEEIVKATKNADEFGGITGELALPADATLGVYNLIIDSPNIGGGTFRVEEYKKPEYEVKVDAPTEPIQLGDKIVSTINAKYYFGGAVQNAKVKYKVERRTHDSRWYPVTPWDWLYGKGYWWFASDYSWYPGFGTWGCLRPMMPWWPRNNAPPEIVAQGEGALDADGNLKLTIDTLPAKLLHGNEDHQYAITAEVVDQSRRTIVGSGNVLVARRPFKVHVWLNRGYLQAGDRFEVHAAAHTLAQKPVAGQGAIILYRVTYDDSQKPVETEIQRAAIHPNDQGEATHVLTAAQPGQYRIAYTLTDAKGHTEEGGQVFVVRGSGFTGKEFRFNDLEIVLDKQNYQPGEKARVLINTNQVGGTVALFLRPTNGVYLPPKIIRLDGKSTVEEIDVTTQDMPNFYIEAVTVTNAKVYSEAKSLAVPPEKRIVNVEVLPSAKEYLPGQKGEIKVKLTDLDGRPFTGSTVVTMYDRSIEYISGGSNVPEIKEFFWKWRREHYPQTRNSLTRLFEAVVRENEETMRRWQETSEAGERMVFGNGAIRGGGRGRPVPAAAPMMMKSMAKEGTARSFFAAPLDAASDLRGEASAPAEASPTATPTVRKNFADTALWIADLRADSDGIATIPVTMPENLTGWKIRTWSMGHGTRVGQGEADVVTRKNIMVRLQAPRFFIEKDEVVLSAIVHNEFNDEQTLQVSLELEGASLELLAQPGQSLTLKPHSQQRVDWRVKVLKEGEAVIRAKALGRTESDAMEMKYPVYVHGMIKTESYTGSVRPDQQSQKVTIKIPAERRIDESRLEIRYSPTLAGAMVDALPYLVDYPYGCTEQTLNRFLPTVITQKILLDMKLDLKAIQEKRTNLNAQEIGDDRKRAAQWKRPDRNPVFDEVEVQRMVKEGLKALYDMQLSDGGWGWFSGSGEYPSAHTTAVVVHGLQVAKQNDVAVVADALTRGIDWLKRYQAEQIQWLKNADQQLKETRWKSSADNLDALIYLILADADSASPEMSEYLYRDRTKLSVYGMTLYALALEKQKQTEKLQMLLTNLDQYLVQDAENETAYLKFADGYAWWYWHGSDIEANAYYLKLLSRTSPKDPKAARLVKYLLNNRKHATYWNSTRDTALCIEALADYWKASGEDQPDLTVEVLLDGQKKKEVRITRENLFTYDNALVLTGKEITSGEHTFEIRRTGTGPVYFNAYVTNFTLEDFITHAGLEVKVNRKIYKLVPEDKQVNVAGSRGQVVSQKVEKYRREELPSGIMLKSGDLIEVELEIDSKNDYEYLMFEDKKAAGFEPVDTRSGYNGNSLGAYMELRDERVSFFVRQLARGKHSVSYRLRAEIPGSFSALPAVGSAMYAPELKANSDEIKIKIED